MSVVSHSRRLIQSSGCCRRYTDKIRQCLKLGRSQVVIPPPEIVLSSCLNRWSSCLSSRRQKIIVARARAVVSVPAEIMFVPSSPSRSMAFSAAGTVGSWSMLTMTASEVNFSLLTPRWILWRISACDTSRSAAPGCTSRRMGIGSLFVVRVRKGKKRVRC